MGLCIEAIFERYRALARRWKRGVPDGPIAMQGPQRVGQRTQLEVLNSQSTVLDAQVSLVGARKSRLTAGYALVAAMGRLNSRRLRLPVRHYDPVEHFEEVKDMWFGLRTPSGR